MPEAWGREERWRPPGARGLGAGLQRLDQAFDWAYSSRFNPLQRTGTLTALFLTITLVTGVYLLFVYELARPYASMVAMQQDVLLGRWIRALHRYASDAAVVTVFLHVARLVAQGKTWGPRILAWITGVLLLGAMFLSAFTGFVLVWDAFGQQLAVLGAKMLRLVPLFVEPPDRAFVGETPVPPAFFFMNLFLHVAIPLGMVALLWLHTSKLARAAWLPERRVTAAVLAAFVGLSILWPVPLAPPADLLALPGRMPADWFYGFWMPLAALSPVSALLAVVAAAGLLLAVPWLLRPRAAARPIPASADPERCEGCRQCAEDCPYDAIEMVPGLHPEHHPLRAMVRAEACVSCGVCVGSCASLAIGPDGQTAWHQLRAARDLVKKTAAAEDTTLVIVCRNNPGVAARLEAWRAERPLVSTVEIDCAGSLHPATVAYAASRFGGVVVAGCPAESCTYRGGAMLLDARILEGRRPALPGRIAPGAVQVLHHSVGEWPALLAAIAGSRPRAAAPWRPRGRPAARAGVALGMTAALLALVALGSAAPQGTPPDHAVLRLGWRFTGQPAQVCRDLDAGELARRPVHMRVERECSREPLAYVLEAAVEGQTVLLTKVRSRGLRADRPLVVEENLVLTPGEREVRVTFAPEHPERGGTVLAFSGRVQFEAGRVVLMRTAGDTLVIQ